MAVPHAVLLRNARIVLPEGTVESANLLIENARIGPIFDPRETPPRSEVVIDLDNLTLFPGFIDVHIHGAAGVDTMEASADDLSIVAEFLARNGVTAWLPTLVPSPQEQYGRAISAIEDAMAQASICDPERRSEYRLQSG